MQVQTPSANLIYSYRQQLSQQSYQLLQIKALLEQCSMQELPLILNALQNMQANVKEQQAICEQLYK